MTAIKENTDFAKDLGLLPISQKESDRHVPRFADVDARNKESLNNTESDLSFSLDSESDEDLVDNNELSSTKENEIPGILTINHYWFY